MSPEITPPSPALLEALLLQSSGSWRTLERLGRETPPPSDPLSACLLSALCSPAIQAPEQSRESLTALAQLSPRAARALGLSRTLMALAQEQLLLHENDEARVTLRQALASSVKALEATAQPLPAPRADQIFSRVGPLSETLASQLDLANASRRQAVPAQLVLVLGMHRSGTSALSGLLVHAGLQAPHDPMPATPANPRGYWESLGVVALNDELLAQLGSHWSRSWDLPEAVWAVHGEAIRRWRSRLLRLLQTRYPAGGRAVLKDPRLCVLLPALQPWLESPTLSCALFLTIRHPAEVAESLHLADGIRRRDALLLWLGHVLRAERDSRPLPRMIVEYVRLISDPRSILAEADSLLARAGNGHGAPLDWDQQRGLAFIDPQLHRQRTSLQTPAWIEEEGAEAFYALAMRVHAAMADQQLTEPERRTRLDRLWNAWKMLAP